MDLLGRLGEELKEKKPHLRKAIDARICDMREQAEGGGISFDEMELALRSEFSKPLTKPKILKTKKTTFRK